MKNTIFALTAVTLSAVSAPAMAGTIQAEVRLGDVRGGTKPDSTEYNVQYTAPLNSLLNYGAEIEVKQKNGAGPLTSRVSARVGPALPTVLGFKTAAYAEAGESLGLGDDYGFWGAGVTTSHKIAGPVVANVGYRHRGSFTLTRRLDENELNGGLGLSIGHGNNLGVQYYRTTGTTRSDAIGLAFNHAF
jgi:hypothetical protein